MALLRRGRVFNGTAFRLFCFVRDHHRSVTLISRHGRLPCGFHSQTKAVGRDAVSDMKEVTLVTENRNTVHCSGDKNVSPSVQGISSPQAYLYRVRHGRFDSLVTLMSAPCAPHPLRVVADVLDEAKRLKECLAEKKRDSELSNSDDSKDKTLESFSRVTRCLSDVLDVRIVLGAAISALQEATEAADALGDKLSEREFRKELREADFLSERLRQWCGSPKAGDDPWEGCSRGNTNSLLWTLPNVVRVEIQRALLVICSLTGAYTTAVEALEDLITLSEVSNFKREELRLQEEQECDGRRERNQTSGKPVDGIDSRETTFALDDVVASVEKEIQQHFSPISAEDHVKAIKSCRRARNFDIAYSLFRRFMQHAESGAFVIDAAHVTAALVALAQSSGNTAEFAMVQELLVKSEVTQVVPVSVELYTALIDAVGRASENPKRLEVGLALYRQLRDGGLEPTADTYAALIACCAGAKETTMGFGFYHEARQQCGVGKLTPAVYTNLLLTYAYAGYGTDARKTIEVLVEAGAPLTRSAFHAVLACAVTQRDAEEVLQLMQSKYSIAPTPQTYAYLIAATGATPAGPSTVLSIFDWQEMALRSFLERDADAANSDHHGLLERHSAERTALSTSEAAPELEKEILSLYPAYGEALELSLLQLRIDPRDDPRLEPYLRPLLRVAQQRMNSFTMMAPQAPTFIPKGSAIAVLAADVLANIDEYFLPFVSYYSAVVIPYSSLVALQRGGGRRVSTTREEDPINLLSDPLYREFGTERRQMLEARRSALQRFLQKYHDVIHLVSLAEELAMSRDCDRYGIPVKKTFTRCAALALNLAREDVPNVTKVYAEQECQVVLVSSNYEKCGRFVVDIKQELLRRDSSQRLSKTGTRSKLSGLKAGLQRMHYHNPRTSPDWKPPVVSVASLVGDLGTVAMTTWMSSFDSCCRNE